MPTNSLTEMRHLRDISEKNKLFMVELFQGTNELREKLEGLKEMTNEIYKAQRMSIFDYEQGTKNQLLLVAR